jgi:hypothetical protein
MQTKICHGFVVICNSTEALLTLAITFLMHMDKTMRHL